MLTDRVARAPRFPLRRRQGISGPRPYEACSYGGGCWASSAVWPVGWKQPSQPDLP